MPKRTQLAMLLTDAAPGQAMPISLRTQVDSPPPVASPKEPVAEQVEDAGLPPGVLGEIAPAPVKTPPPAEVQPVESSPTIMSPILPYVAWQPMGGSVFSESIVPELTPAPSSSVAAVTPEPKPSPAMQAAKDLPPETDIARVQSRVRDAVSDELYENFDMYLYISKADHGPWAQHMYVFAKDEDGAKDWSTLKLKRVWKVSTGREAIEDHNGGVVQTSTPVGLFQLNPNRMFVKYRSIIWDADMPYAMFFNWIHGGRLSGVAIHSSGKSHAAMLGKRASAGCIRLGPKQAQELFGSIQEHYQGSVPRFVMNRKTRTMSRDGEISHDKSGKIRLTDGFRVLVMVEDYGGEDTVISML